MARSRIATRLHLLTVKQVMAFGEGDHTDGGGLLLRIRPGSVAWVFRYTSPAGRRREMGLGVAHRSNPSIAGASITGARGLANEARTLLAQGTDPIEHRQERRAAAQDELRSHSEAREREHWTLARAARDYHARVIEPSRTTKHAAQWISSLEHHVAKPVWNKPVDQVEAPELLEALSKVRALDDEKSTIPETLQRVRQRLDAVFEDAIFHGRCKTNPAAAIRRKMQETLPRKRAGQFAALPYLEAPAFMTALRRAEGIAARALEFAMLTASRTSEVLLADWREFDLEAALWVVPGARMKGKDEHAVHLSPAAVTVLRSMRELESGHQWVFPSPADRRRPLSNMAMLTVLRRMETADRTTVHGLCRATFSTWANETGAARPDVIEACLAHEESNRVRAAYNRAQFAQERRQLLADWGAYLASPRGQVIPFSQAA